VPDFAPLEAFCDGGPTRPRRVPYISGDFYLAPRFSFGVFPRKRNPEPLVLMLHKRNTQ